MTLHGIEHAVVMDTDDIPGRGGYAVVGMSKDVSPEERVFVAQNFGISDFLHDTVNERTFYSFFRVPGSERHALVRRFAKGRRRNQTQNRLFIHTLFIDDTLFEALERMPWLLIEAQVSAAGSIASDGLKDDLPWLVVDAPLPPLVAEIDAGLVTALSDRLKKRLESLERLLGQPARDAVAAVFTSLGRDGHVELPQGVAHERLTMLAWSMLPYPDRAEIAWTQHDARNLAGVVFHIGNTPALTAPVDATVHPTARLIVDLTAASDDERHKLDARTTEYGLSIQRIDDIKSWFEWRDKLHRVREMIRTDEVLKHLKKLAATARLNHDDPWINGEEVLEILWENVPAEIAAGKGKRETVERWAILLRDSGLGAIIFRKPPNPAWLTHAAGHGAANDVGADLLIRFFLSGTATEPNAAPVRTEVARWLLDLTSHDVLPDTMAFLAMRLAADHSELSQAMLELLLANDSGVVAALNHTPLRTDVGTFVVDVSQLGVRKGHQHASDFLADVLVPHLELSTKLAAMIDPELVAPIARLLRDEPKTCLRFIAQLKSEVVPALHAEIESWMETEPQQTAPLAAAILPQMVAGPGGATEAAPLAIALANAGQPAKVWFGVLLEQAAGIDTRSDRRATTEFAVSLKGLTTLSKKQRLEEGLDLLLLLLQEAAAKHLRIGDNVRSLILLLRPVWKTKAKALTTAIAELLKQTTWITGWDRIVTAIVDELRSTPSVHGELSTLVVEYWLTVDPSNVPEIDRPLIDAISIVDARGRERLTEAWRTRLQRLPDSKSSERLLAHLFPERGSREREVRISFSLRAIAQRKGTHATLNGLDVEFSTDEETYVERMSEAIASYTRQTDPVLRVLAYLTLLHASDVKQSVKWIIEVVLLPQTLRPLKPTLLRELAFAQQASRVFSRGVATMSFGYELGLRAKANAQNAFESACRGRRRVDGIQGLREGQRRRGILQWVMRLIGRDQPLLVQQ